MVNDRWTPLLRDADTDVAGAKAPLFAALSAELHQLPERHLRRNTGVAVSPTALLHEAFIGLARRYAGFPDRRHFTGYASRVTRGLIIEFARERRAQKRGADFHITRLDTGIAEEHATASAEDPKLLRLSEELDSFPTQEPRLAEDVDLEYYCGLSFVELAACAGSQSAPYSAIGRRHASSSVASSRTALPRNTGLAWRVSASAS